MDQHGESWVGRTLKGRYRVEKALRAGGMGAVYQGVDADMGDRPVVVKHPLRPVGGGRQASFGDSLGAVSREGVVRFIEGLAADPFVQ